MRDICKTTVEADGWTTNETTEWDELTAATPATKLSHRDIAALRYAKRLQDQGDFDGIGTSHAKRRAHYERLMRAGLLSDAGLGCLEWSDREVPIFAITDAGRAALAAADR